MRTMDRSPATSARNVSPPCPPDSGVSSGGAPVSSPMPRRSTPRCCHRAAVDKVTAMALIQLVTLPLRVGVAATQVTLALGELVAPDGPVRREGGYAERLMAVIGEGGHVERLARTITDPSGPMTLVSALADAMSPDRPLGRALAPSGALDRLLAVDGPLYRLLEEEGAVDRLLAQGGPLDQLVAPDGPLERLLSVDGALDRITREGGVL